MPSSLSGVTCVVSTLPFSFSDTVYSAITMSLYHSSLTYELQFEQFDPVCLYKFTCSVLCVTAQKIKHAVTPCYLSRLSKAGIPVRFCTNETQCTKQEIAGKLNRLGFSLDAANIFPPAPAVRLVAKQRGLRPHLLVHPG